MPNFDSFAISSSDERDEISMDEEEIQVLDYTKFSIDAIRSPPSATSLGSVLTLTNTIVGGGLLAVPFGLSCTGILLGYFILVVITLLSSISATFLVRSVHKSTRQQIIEIIPSYRDLAIQCWGRLGAVLVDITFIVLLIGALTGYLIIICELISEYFNFNFGGYVLVTFLVSMFGIIPLSMINKLHYLRFTSGIALICDIYFLSVVFYNFYQNVINNPSWNSDDVYLYYNPNLISIFLGFPIIAFAYTFQMSVLPIYEELKNRSETKMISIIYFSMVISSVFYVFISTFGYLTYGNSIRGNIMNNIEGEGETWVRLSKLIYAFGLIFSFPVLNFVQLLSLDNLLFRSIYGFAEKRVWFEPVNSFNQNRSSNTIEGRGICCVKLGKILPERSFKRRFFLVVLSVSIMALFSILIPKIQIVFGIVGATSGSLTVFIFPGLFIWYLDPNKKVRLFSLVVIIFGVITGVICFLSWIAEIFVDIAEDL